MYHTIRAVLGLLLLATLCAGCDPDVVSPIEPEVSPTGLPGNWVLRYASNDFVYRYYGAGDTTITYLEAHSVPPVNYVLTVGEDDGSISTVGAASFARYFYNDAGESARDTVVDAGRFDGTVYRLNGNQLTVENADGHTNDLTVLTLDATDLVLEGRQIENDTFFSLLIEGTVRYEFERR